MSDLLDATSMIAKAEAATGLSDWGGELFRRPFAVSLADLREHAQLDEQGKTCVLRRLADHLPYDAMRIDTLQRDQAIAARKRSVDKRFGF